MSFLRNQSHNAPGNQQPAISSDSVDSARVELFEVLDRLVTYEHYYHSVYGRFTKLTMKTGYAVPRSVLERYDIRVVEASEDRLVVSAYGDSSNGAEDFVSIDQSYKVRANFRVPEPRSEFLRQQALRQLRALRESLPGRSVVEQGIFRDYFRYEAKEERGPRVYVAIGTRPPVKGLEVELSEEAAISVVSTADDHVGQRVDQGLLGSALAQRIFLGEIGRYAKSWDELEKITRLVEPREERKPAEVSSPAGRQDSNAVMVDGLVIEPIAPDELSSLRR